MLKFLILLLDFSKIKKKLASNFVFLDENFPTRIFADIQKFMGEELPLAPGHDATAFQKYSTSLIIVFVLYRSLHV